MIHISCPSCQTVFEAADPTPGTAIACPACGRRLQIAAPAPRPFTPAGPAPDAFTPALPPAGLPVARAALPPDVRTGAPEGQNLVYWPCRFCNTQLSTRLGSAVQSVKCPTCDRVSSVPDEAAQPPILMEVPSPPEVHIAPRRNRDRYDQEREEERRRRRRPNRYKDDWGPDPRALRGLATAGFLCAFIGLVLVLFAMLLLLLSTSSKLRDASAALGVFMLIALVVGFVLSLLGVTFGARGMNLANEHNRSSGLAGLVIGIIGLTFSTIFGFIMCLGLLTLGGTW